MVGIVRVAFSWAILVVSRKDAELQKRTVAWVRDTRLTNDKVSEGQQTARNWEWIQFLKNSC